MPELETFIGQKFRPNVLGGKLDKQHEPIFCISNELKQAEEFCLTVIPPFLTDIKSRGLSSH